MSFSFEDKLAAIEHELALRQWWLAESSSIKPLKTESQFRQIQILEAIGRDYRGAIARQNTKPVSNAPSHLRVVRSETDD